MASQKLGAALYLSIADLFIGASGVLIVLIILASPDSDRKVLRFVDLLVSCTRSEDGWQLQRKTEGAETTGAGNGEPKGIEIWVKDLHFEGLLARVGVLADRNQLSCFKDFDNAVLAHNRSLSARGTKGVAIAAFLIPSSKMRLR